MSDDLAGRRLTQVLAAFAAVYLIWGSTYLAIRVAISSIPPAASAGLRSVVAGTIMLLAMRMRGERLAAPRRELLSIAVIGFLLIVCGNGLVVWSEQYVASGLAALIVATVPLWISILAHLSSGGERLPLRGWIGVLLGLVGLCALLWPKLDGGFGTEGLGVLTLILASLCWAIGSLYAKRVTFTLSPLVASGWQMLMAGSALSLIAAMSGEFTHLAPSWASCVAMAYLIVFGSCVGFTAYGWLLQHVPAAKVATYAYVNPVIAVFLGCAFLHEPFTASMLLGTPIILVAVGLVITAHMRSVRRVAPARVRTSARRRAA